MHKRGFTIVELAVVLVIIGIILGMAIKGKQLVEAAKIRAEVSKIHKFEAAVYTYYVLKNELPPYGTYQIIDNESFIELGLLTAKDLQSEFAVDDDTAWMFHTCRLNADSYFTRPNQTTALTEVFNNVCVSMGKWWQPNNAMSYSYTNPRHACYIENLIDDNDLLGGEGRHMYVKQNTVIDFNDCSIVSETAPLYYGYKVF